MTLLELTDDDRHSDVGRQPTELFKWQKNGKEGRHFCCDLMDKNGDCIRAVAYNAVADDIFPRLKENQVCQIRPVTWWLLGDLKKLA